MQILGTNMNAAETGLMLRKAELFEESSNAIHKRADRLFANLMIVQWLAGIAAAVWISPQTWIGATSHIHWHVWAAVFLGGAITILPVFLAWKQPGQTLTRHVIAVAQMLSSALLIHLTGGRIETHFHVFGSLAFMAFYRDWRVLMTATVVVALDHMARGLFWPQSVFGVLATSPWRWVEHAGWVLFEDIFLFISIRHSFRDMEDAALRHAKLETVNASIELQVIDRTAELTAANQKSQANEARLRLILETVPECVKVVAEDGTLLDMNSAGLAMIEVDNLEQVAGKSVYELLPEQYQPQFQALNEAVFRGEYATLEFEIVGQKGTHRWLETHACPMRDAEGRIIAQLAVTRDISERKRTEQVLRDSELRYRQLVHALPAAIYTCDAEGRVTLFNHAAAELWGCKPELGKDLWCGSWRIYEPDGQPLPVEECPMALTLLRGQKVQSREIVVERPDGKRIHVLPHPNLIFDSTGQVIGAVNMLMDLTERKRAEEALRLKEEFAKAVLNSLTANIAVLDASGTIIAVNETWEKFAQDNGDPGCIHTGLGMNYLDVLMRAEGGLAAESDRALEGIQAVLGGNREAFSLEYPCHSPREKRWFTLLVTPLTNGRHGVVVTHINITERKLAEAKLEKVHKDLLQTSRMAGMAEVATGVLHNVGNVLNSVNVASTCIADGIRKSKATNLAKVVALLRAHETDIGGFFANDPKGKQIPGYLAQLAEHVAGEQAAALKELGELQQHIDHIKEIVSTQQSFANVSGLTEILNVTEVVEEALRLNQSSLVNHRLHIVREFAAVPPITVEKHKVLQILVNLLQNAKQSCKTSDRDEKQVTLRIMNDTDRVCISVSDTGVGIPAENLTRIFHHGFTTKKEGHGFGLHNAANAAKEMGGALHVHSDGDGCGATFTLELPHLPKQKRTTDMSTINTCASADDATHLNVRSTGSDL